MFIDICYSLFINSDCVMLADWNLNAETVLKNSITCTVITHSLWKPIWKKSTINGLCLAFFMLKNDYKYELYTLRQ